ncbi:uncharacterized protein LOC130749928 [Actinidia eriantha]|uniref:uncharacterized protein LOC130749928 n=1 Tax=Actinidia eriantha TaxID=165200 RepID=UPI002590F25E|nr:uncharacterized protein LOC130749928 [Actinidia eriantha]
MAYLDEIKTMSGKIKDFKICQIPREENKKVDALANLTSAFDFILDRSIPLEFLASPSIGVANPVFQAKEGPTWMDEIFVYLRDDIDSLPEANKQVEVTNRTILRNLKARLERSKSEWAKELPSILWAYHTTSRAPTGETPYSMVFGTESVIPVEIRMPSFRTSTFSKENIETELRLNLDLLDEKREKAKLHQATYKCRVAKYYNQRAKHRSFLSGDLVLRKVALPTK